MITRVSLHNYKSFLNACKIEPIFGCEISCTSATYSLENPVHKFYIDDHLSTAIYISGKEALISSNNNIETKELCEFLNSQNIKEISTNLSQCQKIKTKLGGKLESSYFMKYIHRTPPNCKKGGIMPTTDLDCIFNILRQSHEFYLNHLDYNDWCDNIKAKLQKKNILLIILLKDNVPVGTGSIIAKNETCGVLGEIAVLPNERGNGYGKQITCYLTSYLLNKGKIPMLISGYDEVAKMYQKIGYQEYGRWGQLFL